MVIYQPIYYKQRIAKSLAILCFCANIRFGGVIMWTRKGLKQETKEWLKSFYWKAFIVCLIATIFTSGFKGKRETRYDFNHTIPSLTTEEYRIELSPGPNRFIFDNFFENPFTIRVLGFGTFFLIGLASVVITVIIGNLLIVGEKRFFINAFRGDEVKISTVLSAMRKDQWLPMAGKMFLLDIYLFLWFLLLIVPGIIKSYQYKFVPYILAEDPELTLSEAISLSSQLTDGHKSEMLVLDLSFIGWHILGGLFFGIGSIFIAPYQRGTFVKLYEHLRGDFSTGVYEQFYD